MRKSIARVFIATSLFSFAFAKSHSSAVLTPPPSSPRVELIQQASPLESDIPLKPGETRDEQIARDKTQAFTVDLAAGQFADVVLEWQGINLNVALFDPAGTRLVAADVQVVAPGPVSVSILAQKSGAYKLQVTTPVKQKISGKYRVRLETPRLPTDADRKRVAAQIKIAQAPNAPDTAAARILTYTEALALLQEAGDVNGQARVSMLLGDAYRSEGEKKNASASYEQAATIWKGNNYPRGEAYARVSLGHFYRSMVSAKEALPHFEQAQLLFAQINDRRGQADALFERAFALMRMSQTLEAIEVLQQILKIRRAESDRMGEARALNVMVDAYRQLGDFDKSLDLYDQARQALNGLEHRSLETILLNNKTLVLQDQGHWQEAKAEYEHVIAEFESLLEKPIMSICVSTSSLDNASNCRSVAIALFNLGETYNSLGEPDIAVHEFSKALLISDALKQPDAQGEARFHLGYAHFLLGNTAKALEYYLDALKFQEKNETAKALTYTYLGMVHTARNEHATALEFYRKASKIQMPSNGKPSGDKRALAITLDKLAAGYSSVGNATEASANFAKALELWRATKDPEGEALTLYHMAIAEAGAGHLAEASQRAELAIKLVESLRTRLTSQRLRTSYLATQADYYQLNVHLKMQLAKSGSQTDDVAGALESNEKGRARALLDALSEANVGRSEFNQNSDPKFAILAEQRQSMLSKLGDKAQTRARLLSGEHSSEQIAAIDRQIDEITEQLDGLEAQIRSANPRFAVLTKPRPSTLKEIQEQLEADTLLLEYSLGETRSYVWAVTQDSIKGIELPARREIEATVQRLTNALTDRNREVKDESAEQWRRRIKLADGEFSAASATLSKIVIDPVASLLGNKRLVIVADGVLQLVSFGALPAPKTANAPNTVAARTRTPARNLNVRRALLEDHEIVYEPSASVLALQRRELENRKPAPNAVAVLANPVFEKDDDRVVKAIAQTGGQPTATNVEVAASRNPNDGNRNRKDITRALDDLGISRFQRLRSSEKEAEAIRKVAPKAGFMAALDFEANRAKAMSKELSNYRIVHFATHGVVDYQHPELSGIVLSMVDKKGQDQDGYLRLHDIYNLNLPADLVVLSACQTGVGKQIKGEGLIALTRGFMYAGAPRVVASLWKVEDTATAALMAEFYKQMFTLGLKPAAALRQAQLTLSRQPSRRHPYYWAGFVLQGEWR